MQPRTLGLTAVLLSVGSAALAQAPPAVPPAAPAAQTYTLRYQFKQGDTNYYKLVTDTDGTVGGGPGGQSFPIKQHMVFFYHQTVTGVNAMDGSATLVTKFDHLDMTMNGQPLPNAQAMTDQLQSHGITTTLSPTGKPTVVKADVADAVPGMDLSKLGNFQGAAQLPDAPVKVGDTWKGAAALNGAFGPEMTGLQASVASTLTGVEGAGGKIIASISQTTTADFDSSTAPGPGAEVTTAGKVSGTGVTRFDTGGGFVVGQTSTSTLTMTLGPKGAGGAATGMTGPMKIQFRITTDLQKVDAVSVPKAVPAPAAPPPA